MKKNNMNYGNRDVLTADDLDIKKGKIRITTMIDYPIYEALNSEAKKKGAKYQTLLNDILKNYFDNDHGDVKGKVVVEGGVITQEQMQKLIKIIEKKLAQKYGLKKQSA